MAPSELVDRRERENDIVLYLASRIQVSQLEQTELSFMTDKSFTKDTLRQIYVKANGIIIATRFAKVFKY